MHKAPSVARPREIFDSHGWLLGQTSGFRPDPESGILGLELELAPETIEEMNSNVRSVWIPANQVMAVRRDRMTLELSLEELHRYVRTPAMKATGLEGAVTRERLEA